MQINGLSSLLQSLLADTSRPAAPAPFVSETPAPPPAAQPTVGSPAQSVQMLVTLAAAAIPPQLERRRHLTKKAERGLDALEMLQAALVTGVGAAEPVRELRSWMEERSPADDPQLAAIMDEIDLRIQVELAKLERDQTVPADASSAALSPDASRNR